MPIDLAVVLLGATGDNSPAQMRVHAETNESEIAEMGSDGHGKSRERIRRHAYELYEAGGREQWDHGKYHPSFNQPEGGTHDSG